MDTTFSDWFIVDGEWHHYCMVSDSSGGSLYVDGELVGTRSATGGEQ